MSFGHTYSPKDCFFNVNILDSYKGFTYLSKGNKCYITVFFLELSKITYLSVGTVGLQRVSVSLDLENTECFQNAEDILVLWL